MRATQGLYSSHDPRLFFGLGPVEESSGPVHWPSGARSEVERPALNSVLTLTEPARD